MEHCVNDEVLGPVFWEIIVLRMKMARAEVVFSAIEEYVSQIFEIMQQRDDVISDEQYRNLAKILEREVLWLKDVDNRLLFWAELCDELKNELIQKS